MNNAIIYTIVPETINGNYTGDYKYEDVVRASWCYLHGELENMVGYDIFSMLRAELKPEQIDERWLSDEFVEGIYQCVCMGKPCTFFRWKNYNYHGLVVLNTDKDAYEYASKCYEEKKYSI
jgi:hypothetical protein